MGWWSLLCHFTMQWYESLDRSSHPHQHLPSLPWLACSFFLLAEVWPAYCDDVMGTRKIIHFPTQSVVNSLQWRTLIEQHDLRLPLPQSALLRQADETIHGFYFLFKWALKPTIILCCRSKELWLYQSLIETSFGSKVSAILGKC